MREPLEEIRQALASRGALDTEATEALEALQSALESVDRHPDSDRIEEVVRHTAGSLSGAGDATEETTGLSAKWQELKEGIVHWEEEHPRVVMAVGRISDALAVVGL